MTDLKKCPFRGGEAYLSSAEAGIDGLSRDARNPRCGSCGSDQGYCADSVAATKSWNTRPEQDRLEALAYENIELGVTWKSHVTQDREMCQAAIDETKRLEALNAQLVEALEDIVDQLGGGIDSAVDAKIMFDMARYALEKAKAKVNDQKEPTNERGIREMMRDPKYWRERDPEIVKAVAKAFKELYPSKGE